MTINKNYYRDMPGKGSKDAEEFYQGNFIGVDYGINIDLAGKVPDSLQEFNKEMIPYYLERHPEKLNTPAPNIAAGLACGQIYTLAKLMKEGDVVLCPNNNESCRIGEITGDYYYYPDGHYCHRRPVKWLQSIARDDMSPELKKVVWGRKTIWDITKYANEIEQFLSGNTTASMNTIDETIEDATSFKLEKQLENFLVENWNQTTLGQQYDIYEVDGELVGQQYESGTGPIDILAISKDKKTLLVVELKRGRASDRVVGQVQRYMGCVLDLAKEGQSVRGAIIALEDDDRIRKALKVASNIDFYRYEISFKLFKA